MSPSRLAAQPAAREALALVQAHADAMLRYGTDHYGPRKTHFFTQMIDLRSLEAPTQRTLADWAVETKNWKEDTNYDYWGKFWNAKESPQSGNLGRDAEFLNALYALSRITGDRKYADAADAYLWDVIRLAIHPQTGFFASGAHLNYDLLEDKVSGRRHEIERQIVPYWRIWQMKPNAITRYADAIMAGHFQDRKRFGWNRHADWDTNNPGTEYGNFAEYGAAFTYLWAFACSRTHDPKYREWMEKLTISYASKGDETTARFPSCWWADRKNGNPIVSRDSPGVAQLFLKACELAPDRWVLSAALAHLDSCHADSPNWEQAAWSAYWQGKPWGGTTALLAYRLSGDGKYLQWARGFAERLEGVARPKAMMAMMVAGNIDFFTQLYLATGERRWFDKALEFVNLAGQFAQPSGLFAGAIGLDRPLYYDATQGPGYLSEALIRLYQAAQREPDPKAYVKHRLAYPTVALEWAPQRWAGSQPLLVRAQITAPLGVADARLEYTRDDVIGGSIRGRRVSGNLYEFRLPPMGKGFDGGVSLAVSAGNGPDPLNWRTSNWRQITVFPQQTVTAQAGKKVIFAAAVEAAIKASGTLSLARYHWNPVATEPTALGTGSGEYIELAGSAAPATLRIKIKSESVQQLIADSVRLACWQNGQWQVVKTTVDQAAWTLSTTQASTGLWTVVGRSRIAWKFFAPNAYYAPAVADFMDNGRLQMLIPDARHSGNGTFPLIDGDGKVSFQDKDRLPASPMRYAPPAAADINGDGKPEVVISNEDGNIWCLDRTGKVLWNYLAGGGFWTPVAVGDVNGDGKPEVAAGCDDHFLYLLDAAGNLLWKHEFDGAIETSPVMADVDGDGVLDVLAGSDQGKVAVLKGDGKLLWELTAGAGANGVTAADVDGDGRTEVAISLGNGEMILLDERGKLRWKYAWRPNDPDLVGIYQTGAADINGDGKREIVASTEDGYCLAVSHDGKLLWSADVEGRANGSPTFLDLDGDGKFEVIIGSTAHVLKALSGDGATIWRFKDTGSFYHTVAADLDGDRLVEVFGTGPGGNWCLRTEMRCKPYEVFWTMQRGDACRSAVR